MIEVYLSHGALYHYPLMPFFNMASKCGFDGVEIIVGRNRELSDISYMKHLAAKYSTPVRVIHSPFNSWNNELWPKTTPGKIMQSVEMAKALGAGVVVAHTALSNETEYKKWMSEDLAAYQAKAEPVKIGVENMPRRFVMFGGLGRMLHGYKRLDYKFRRSLTYDMATHTRRMEFLRPVELDDIDNSHNHISVLDGFKYLTVDTTHLGTWGCEPADYLDMVSGEIVHVHLSNYQLGREHRLPLDGRMDLAAFLKKLAERGYSRGITIETDPSSLRDHRSFAETSRELKENMEFVRGFFK